MSRTREGEAAYTSRSGYGRTRKWILFKDNKDVRKRIWHLVNNEGKVIRKQTGAVNVGGNAAEATRRSESAFRSAAQTTSGRGAGRSAFSTRPPKKNNKKESPDATEGPKDNTTEGPKDDKDEKLKKVQINQGANSVPTNTNKEAPKTKVKKTDAEKHNEGIKKAAENLPEQKEVVAKELEGKIRRMGMSGKRGILGIKKRKAMEAEIKRLRKKKPDDEQNKNGKH